MHASYRVKASELDQSFIEGIKATYGDQEIEIIVYPVDETSYLLQSSVNKERLLNAIKNVQQNQQLVEVAWEDLE